MVTNFLLAHWFAFLLLAAGLILGAFLLRTWLREKRLDLALLLPGAALALMGLGGALLLEMAWALWLGGAAAAVLFGMLLLLITTGGWSARLGYAVGAVLCFSLGGLGAGPVGAGLVVAGKTLASFEPVAPWWLLLLVSLPLIIALSFRSLAGLGPVRRWVAIGLRCLLVALLALTLAEVRIKQQNENVTVLFLWDRSLSIPQEPASSPKSPGVQEDARERRVFQFINDSVAKRMNLSGHERDRAGVIVFGRRPRLELPPSDAPRFNFNEVISPVDPNYSDLGAAIKLALASFPEGTGKRIVLLSDGNENLGNAEEQARLAERNGVQIDVVPLASGQRNENEILVQGVEAPPVTEQGSRIPIRVLIRSYNPRPVVGTLQLREMAEGNTRLVPINEGPGVAEMGEKGESPRVLIRPGLNTFTFKQKLEKTAQSYTYEAQFQPELVKIDEERVQRGLPGDRVQNNRATTHVLALSQRRILLIEQEAGKHDLLVDRLSQIGNGKYKVHAITVGRLPENKDELGVFLSAYDCLILADVPADMLSQEQQEMIHNNTHDQGCGLVMIGGKDSFGAGGWQGTPVEKALPVDCDIKSLKVTGKGGLVLIMHACEMAEGNYWQKVIAKTAIRKLSINDEVGVIYYDWQHKWHIDLQVIGGKRNWMMGMVDRMTPGDMPDFDTPLKMAHEKLADPRRGLAARHIIVITDGDPQLTNFGLLAKCKQDKVTISTVGVATHGVNEDKKMTDIATRTGGRFHKVTNPRTLPSIYIKETRIVSQSFVDEKKFQPQLLFKDGPTDKLPDPLPPLYGYVRTTPKQSPLVMKPILAPSPGDQEFPVLAYWNYGLGRSVAFTSDAHSSLNGNVIGWDKDWANSDMYAKFWEQLVDYALRPVETGRLVMTTEHRDGKVRVLVDARDNNNRPLTDLKLRGKVTAPGGKGEESKNLEVELKQRNSGVYEGEFKAEEAGSYFINAQALRVTEKVGEDGARVPVEEAVDGVRSGVTIPYSPEFADLESNLALLDKLRTITGGQKYEDNATSLATVAASGEVFRPEVPKFKNLQPIWYWLLFAAAVLLFFDVAVRRIALEPSAVVVASQKLWTRLRGQPALAAAPEYMERLKSRKAEVGETLDKAKTARRFEGGEAPPTAAAPLGAAAAPAPSTRPAAPRPQTPRVGPDGKEEPTDAMSRLMKAKKKVWEEREKNE